MTSLPSSLPNKREQLLLTTKSIKRARVENSFPNVADSSKARKHRAPDARRSMSNISMPVINPNSTSNSLQLNVSVVGLDTSEAWSYINSSWPPEEDIWGAFRYPGPVYVVVDVLGGDRSGFDVGYSVDGKEAHCGTAVSNGSLFCSYSYNSGLAVQVARRVTYEGRERILFYATTSTTTWTEGWTPAHAPDASTLSSCSNLLVWVCKNETIPDSIPYNVTELNLAQTLSTWSDPRPSPPFSNGLGLLEPGPMVRVNIVLSKRPSARQLSDIRQRLCEAAIWNLTDPGDSDRCEWQLWVELMEGANGEKWDDGARQWIPCGKYDFVEGRAGMELWTVSVTSLMSSNNNASLARNLINTEINSASFISTFQVAAVINVTISGDNGARTGNKQYFAHVTAPYPAFKRAPTSSLGCSSHYECQDGYFCSIYGLQSWKIGTWASCDRCETCFDVQYYPIDQTCPEDRCGPRVGTFPNCWDAQKLMKNSSCQSSYLLNLSLVPGLDTTPDPSAVLGNVQPSTLRARYLTPFNRVVGALIIRQKRFQTQPLNANGSFAVCSIKNDSIGQYSSLADPSRGLLCRGQYQDATFYGADPVFTAASSLYDGKQNPFDFYNASEFADLASESPYGFFPHKYDHRTGGTKTNTLIAEEADNFLVYLDERMSSVHAQDIITYLNDGNFIDQQTAEVSVEINTINAGNSMFCKTVIIFTWEVLILLSSGLD